MNQLFERIEWMNDVMTYSLDIYRHLLEVLVSNLEYYFIKKIISYFGYRLSNEISVYLHLLTLMSFQTCMSFFFFVRNIKDILVTKLFNQTNSEAASENKSWPL